MATQNNQQIRIVHLVNQLAFDGTSQIILELCKCFCHDHDVMIVSLTKNVVLSETTVWPRNVKVFSFDFQYDPDYSLTRYMKIYFNKSILKRSGAEVIHQLNVLKPDILHCHLQPRELILVRYLEKPNIRFLFTDHSVRIKRGQYSLVNTVFLSWIYRLIYRRFHVVSVSKVVYDTNEKFRLASPRKHHFLIQNKIDIERYSPGDGTPEAPLRFIYVARLEKRKGHEVLLHAWRLASLKNAELILVGSGLLENESKELSAKLGLSSVRFTGARDDVAHLLKTAHVGIFPSEQEGLPLSLLEKMACGLPVIVSSIDALTSVVDNEVNGLHFRINDAQDLSEKIKYLSADKDARERLGRNARAYVAEHHDLRYLCDEYRNAYNSLTNWKSEV